MPRPGEKANVPVIIRRRKGGGGHDDEHNTAWKMAFADFMTAMMAMFLLLWMISITSEQQQEGLSNFFNPISVSRSNSGGTGILAGRSVDRQGSLTSPYGPQSSTNPVASPPVEAEIADQDRAANVGDDLSVPQDQGPISTKGQETPGNDKVFGGEDITDFSDGTRSNEYGNDKVYGGEDISKFSGGIAPIEDKRLQSLKEQILNAFRAEPELSDIFSSILFEETPEGLRIQVTDSPYFEMFKTGSSQMNDRAKQLMRLMADSLESIPNSLSVTGHTDAQDFSRPDGYSNWELSADRANAARRLLAASGIESDRFELVQGAADRDPLVSFDPLDPRNRRIAITVLRSTPLPVDLLPSLTDKYRL